jgi:ABC-2 type transport system permease protein
MQLVDKPLTTTQKTPALPSRVVQPRPWLAAAVLCWREIVRFLRQRNRVIGALGQPILFWLLFGAGLQRSFRAGQSNQSFLAYYFPGTLILIILFTAIFATISIIEDRREGFLQGVLVAPIPSWSMVLGKVLGGSLLALGQAFIFLLLALTIHVPLGPLTAMHLLALLFVTSIALTSLGVVIAWRMESTQGFHAIMNLLLMPMWLLSGAFFPVPALTATSDAGQILLHWVMRLNPVTYCLAAVRQLMFGRQLSTDFWMPPSLIWCWIVTVAFAVLTFTAAWKISRQRISGDLV